MLDSMALFRSAQLVFFLCFFFSTYNMNVEGRRFVSEEEDIELEKQLKLLNKPSIKSIQTKHGDIYNCVDFYKQPAFDHPLLKNHTFHHQMRPSSIPQFTTEKEGRNASHSDIGRVDCPFGTVPIRKVTKDDLIRAKMYSEINNYRYDSQNNENPGTHYAVVRTKVDPAKKYYGVGSELIVYYPQVIPTQYSSSRMKIQNGGEFIEAGWTANPMLYGDAKTRYYTSFNGMQPGCFNTRCPGFVLVDTSLPLDRVLEAPPKSLLTVKSFIIRDTPISNWWLSVSGTVIGFWPARLFTSMADSGTYVEWGGEAFSPPAIPSPPMGNGNLVSKFLINTGFNQLLTTVNEAQQAVDAVDLEEYNDIKAYGVLDLPHSPHVARHGMFYGGPGGFTRI